MEDLDKGDVERNLDVIRVCSSGLPEAEGGDPSHQGPRRSPLDPFHSEAEVGHDRGETGGGRGDRLGAAHAFRGQLGLRRVPRNCIEGQMIY